MKTQCNNAINFIKTSANMNSYTTDQIHPIEYVLFDYIEIKQFATRNVSLAKTFQINPCNSRRIRRKVMQHYNAYYIKKKQHRQ